MRTILKSKSLVVGLGLLSGLSTLVGNANAQERRPDPGCGRDVSRLCRAVMDQGDGVILSCLQQHRAKLSAKCAKVLTDNGQ